MHDSEEATAHPARQGPGRSAPRTASVRAALVIAVIVAALPACVATRARTGLHRGEGGAPPTGRILTQAEIRASGARDAMEALERGGTHLVIQRTSNSRVRITHRGVDSFVLSPEVLVVVDGARVSHIESALRGIPAESIRYIQILSGREAVLRYGAESGNGVVAVHTSARN